MNCPHCKYVYGYDFEEENVKPEEGEFYVMPFKMEREADCTGYQMEAVALLACPKCRKAFIGG